MWKPTCNHLYLVNYGDIADIMANMAIFHISVGLYGKLFRFITLFACTTLMGDWSHVTTCHEHYHMECVYYPLSPYR